MAEAAMAVTDLPRRQRGFALPLALRFFLATALLIVLAVGAAVVVTYVQGQGVAKQAVEKALTTSAAVQREFEQRRLEQLELSLRVFASDASFVKYIADATSASTLPGLGGDAGPDTTSMRDLLGDRQKEFGFDLGILLDGKGEVLARTDQNEAFRESLAEDALVAPALQETRPFSGYWRFNNKLYQGAIVPLAQDENVVGFLLLAAAIDDSLARKVAQVSGAEIAFWIPVDKKPTLVASSLESAAAAQLKDVIANSPERLKPMTEGGVALHLGDQEWVAKSAATAAPGEAALGNVVVLASADQIIASYRSILNSVLAAGLASLLAALLLSYVISKGILRPVSAMASAAEAAAAGNFQTRIGIEGKDELARLARAFDSLLSDLREKSDMEGYVGNLARFLPEPGQEGGGAVVELRTRPMAVLQPPHREMHALLGLEFRELLTLPPATAPEAVLSMQQRIQSRLEAMAAVTSGICRPLVGARWLLAFSGQARLVDALRVFREILSEGEFKPAAALADGAMVLASEEHGKQLIGPAQVQIDRLLCDAAPGQLLAGKNAGESVKGALGPDSVAVATGNFSGKPFYAVNNEVLGRLPEPDIGEGATLQRSAVRGASAPRATTPVVSRDTGELAAGTTLGGRYRVLSVLGAGGMGVVYKAHDLELDDVVALKMLKPGALLDAEQLDRLKSEIKLARRITHPNVLRTFDFGEVNGMPYISMEYVRGMTLRFLLREAKRVPYSAGLRIARQLAAGLAAAHEVGVLHRDIKPENLILEANGNAKLMDFGIARPARRAQPGHTQPGTFLGTPNYCAPEQLAGEEVDERADIYSCGVLMTEMFCGALPFSGSNTMEIYMAQMQQEPARPSALWPEVRPELEAVILRCLKRNVAERPRSAADLAAALAQLRA
ncbi:serine/threonine-protein kinase [Tahibacter amnicola]|uniref:Protein kinase n=1 Tax=Tahibacter amnicola TaxID=2976241 RepID=A0ABY6BAV3_9GAMM|nr:serine/threonine-protein kinase [Tahibacter amnicola]UXI66661.1 protein kinase [Tahibacter amnicola]